MKKNTKTKSTTVSQLEAYLRTCPSNCDTHNFETAELAYEFGQKMYDHVMKEEGVNFKDQLQKYSIDISYMTVRIKLLAEELVSC
jgi:hypothetical protein